MAYEGMELYPIINIPERYGEPNWLLNVFTLSKTVAAQIEKFLSSRKNSVPPQSAPSQPQDDLGNVAIV